MILMSLRAISWKSNWANLSTYFKYPQEIRTLIYTTNTIEGFNRQLRKTSKSRSVFPSDDSLFKLLLPYYNGHNTEMDWAPKKLGCNPLQLQIFFEERLK